MLITLFRPDPQSHTTVRENWKRIYNNKAYKKAYNKEDEVYYFNSHSFDSVPVEENV